VPLFLGCGLVLAIRSRLAVGLDPVVTLGGLDAPPAGLSNIKKHGHKRSLT